MASQGERAVLVSRAGARRGQGARQRRLPSYDSTAGPPQAPLRLVGLGREPRNGGKAVPCTRVRAQPESCPSSARAVGPGFRAPCRRVALRPRPPPASPTSGAAPPMGGVGGKAGAALLSAQRECAL